MEKEFRVPKVKIASRGEFEAFPKMKLLPAESLKSAVCCLTFSEANVRLQIKPICNRRKAFYSAIFSVAGIPA
jgi:hypothetical protein